MDMKLSNWNLLFQTIQFVSFEMCIRDRHIEGMSWDLSLNTAISFVTNTNWQAYSGESQLSYLSQALGLTVQNFVTPATGIAVLYALIRGFTRVKGKGVGNFWTDLTRSTLYVLMPLSLAGALMIASQGLSLIHIFLRIVQCFAIIMENGMR